MAATASDLIHYHAPRSRSFVVKWMLNELGVEPETRVLNLSKAEHKSPEFLAVNPMGKVPTIVHKGVVVTETPAICAYLADAFPAAGLAPATDDASRGSYYRAMFFYLGCVEPACGDHAMKREPGPPSQVGYGSFESMLEGLKAIIGGGPYVLGERFTAADVVLGAGVGYMLDFGMLPQQPEFVRYAERMRARPAHQRTASDEAELIKELGL